MESPSTATCSTNPILEDLRNIVGCSGMRSFHDLGKMRLQTLDKRVRAVLKQLQPLAVVRIYVAWLREQAVTWRDKLPNHIIIDWCHSILMAKTSANQVLEMWDRAVLDGSKRDSPLLSTVHGEIRKRMPLASTELDASERPSARDHDMAVSCVATAVFDSPQSSHEWAYDSEAKQYRLPTRPAGTGLAEDLCFMQLRRDEDHKPTLRTDERHTSCVGFVSSKRKANGKPSTADLTRKNGFTRASGHQSKESPTDFAPDCGLLPPADYVCGLCGAHDHYTRRCHLYLESSAGMVQQETPDDQPNAQRPRDHGASVHQPHNLPYPAMVDGSRLDAARPLWPHKELFDSHDDKHQPREDAHQKSSKTAYHIHPDGEAMEEAATVDAEKFLSTLTPECQQSPSGTEHSSKRLKVAPQAHWTSEVLRQENRRSESPCPTAGVHELYMSCMDLCSPSPYPEEVIEPYVSQKRLSESKYHEAVLGFFHNRGNVWVNKLARPTALDMWKPFAPDESMLQYDASMD
ncbi:hypothetical protein S40293_10648 [Stachybotrys chartarum IBT 40293]|nr:hypothetical protein S40293_10648 [Stachybotrys chartarum IBT 40293]